MDKFRGLAWEEGGGIYRGVRRKSGTKSHQVHRNKGAKWRECQRRWREPCSSWVSPKARGEAHSNESQEKSFRWKEKGQHDKIKAIMITGKKRKREKLWES